jgi:hypothetical protein
MSASASVIGLPGVSACVVGDGDGHVLESTPDAQNAETTAAVAAMLGRDLRRLGEVLGLGALEGGTSKGKATTWVLGFKGEATMAVRLSASQPSAAVESVVAAENWPALVEYDVDELEIEYIAVPEADKLRPPEIVAAPASSSAMLVAALNARVTERPPSEVVTDPDEEEARAWESVAAFPVAETPRATRPAPVAGYAGADLRSALMKGQLAQAEIIAATFREKPPADDDSCSGPEFTPLLRVLLDSIAGIVAGDATSAFASLDRVDRDPGAGKTLRWAANLWSARLGATSIAGMTASVLHAETALRLAEGLDPASRAATTCVLADLALQRADLSGALELVMTTRELLAKCETPEDGATCFLLEARVLEQMGRHEESVQAAEVAHRRRPSWPPPVSFLAREALRAGDVDGAERALTAPAAAPAPDIDRSRRIVEHVRAGSFDANLAYEFLRLVDAPPTAETVQALSAMALQLPEVYDIDDTLAWKLLRSGHYPTATPIFERLSSRDDAPEGVRASALLGLGCIATVESRHERTGTKLRAAVSAAPKSLPAMHAASPSSTPPKRAPSERRVLAAPAHAFAADAFPLNEAATSPRRTRGGPVFTGSLQLFCLPDLLEFLRSGQRTGTLVCSSASGIGALHMRAGKVNGAASPSTRAVGHYLVARGVVTEDVLAEISEKAKIAPPPRVPLGIALVQSGVATAEQVRLALHDQIRAALRELLNWGDGQFAFDPENAEPWPFAIEFELDPQALLLEALAEKDEDARDAST